MSARILVVDDIPINVKLLTAKLAAEYYDVTPASDGPMALACIAEAPPDLVLLDVMMPGMTGFEVCRRIKADPASSHIPVVMVTALDSPEDRIEGLEAGADEFLTKPVEDMALFARVRSLVRLKRTIDEWRLREETRSRLGSTISVASLASEPGDTARVLAIVTDPRQAERIERTLARDRHHLTMISDPAAAFDAVRRGPWEVVAVDLDMDGADALRLCSQVRAHEETRHVPLLLLGTKSDSRRLIKGLELGVNDYIEKPLDANELRARVRTQVRRKRFHNRMLQTHEASLALALTDGLTGLYNRNYMDEHLARLLSSAQVEAKPLSLVMVDVDRFKSVNDTYGHAAGDEVLREFARRLGGNLRGVDTLARMGGEEFVIALPEAREKDAGMAAERLRARIAQEPFNIGASLRPLAVTASFGVASARTGDTVASLLERADRALYAAKRSGRNCVMVDGDDMGSPPAPNMRIA
jgi:two-component system cell cycle response regulator